MTLIKDYSLDEIQNLLLPQSESKEFAPESQSMIKAAVLIPFFRINNEWNLLFIRRTDSVHLHKGQVAFPGGAMEAVD